MMNPLKLVAVVVLTSGLAAGQSDSERRRLTPGDGVDGDQFGWSVAIDGTTAIIGSRLDHSPQSNAGSAYLYNTKNGDRLMKLTPSDAHGSHLFGTSVGISAGIAVVGVPNDNDLGFGAGAAYLFDITTGQQLAKLLASDGEAGDFFGASVAISGSHVIVGAQYDENAMGAAYVFDAATGQQLHKLTPINAVGAGWFGCSVGISGSTAIVGAYQATDFGPSSGAAYLFDVNSGQQTHKLLASDGDVGDFFGYSVGISGGIALVGAFGNSDAGSESGSAYLFDPTTGVEQFKLVAGDAESTDHFGGAVAISGDTAVITSNFDGFPTGLYGSAYVFDASTGQQQAKLEPSVGSSDNKFGTAVAVSGTTITVGAYENHAGGSSSGSIYVYDANVMGSNYCTTNPNSTGQAAQISVIGSPSIVADTFQVRAQPVPNEFFIYIYSDQPIQVPFGDGVLCVGGSLHRLNPALSAAGNVAVRNIHLANVGITSVGTYHFQCWFRDPTAGGTGFNLSDGIAVTIVP